MNQRPITRRQMLRAVTGATLALPFLESVHLAEGATAATQPARRLIAINMPLGLYAGGLFPKDLSSPSLKTEYLSDFSEYHSQMTLISGLYHPGVSNGHVCTPRIFTGAPNLNAPDPKLAPNTESFDQVAARHLGHHTRFSSLSMAMHGQFAYSWHENGMALETHRDIPRLFKILFEPDSRESIQDAHRQLDFRHSVLDAVFAHANSVKPKLSQADREKLDEYFHAIRQTEKSLGKQQRWLDTPKPSADGAFLQEAAEETGLIPRARSLLKVAHLALATDSTRIITCDLFEQGNVSIDGVTNGYHGLSHHGQDPENIRQLKIIEQALLRELKTFIGDLANTREADGASLLDHTSVLLVSNLGNGSNHSSQNLPALLIGGGYPHGKHHNFRPANETPLSNLYLTVLQKMGVPTQRFSTSTGPIPFLA